MRWLGNGWRGYITKQALSSLIKNCKHGVWLCVRVCNIVLYIDIYNITNWQLGIAELHANTRERKKQHTFDVDFGQHKCLLN